MLISSEVISGIQLLGADDPATDPLGVVGDLWFDGQNWEVRYLVAETGRWMDARVVLLSPGAVAGRDWAGGTLRLTIPRERVRESPEVETTLPVSRQKELELARHFSWQPHWSIVTGWSLPPTQQELPDESGEAAPGYDPNLRSLEDTTGYHLEARDGEIGHLEHVIVDDHMWAIRYLVVATRNWLPGRHVLIPPEWVRDINWEHSVLRAQVTRAEIEASPDYDPGAPVNREYEEQFYDYYGRPGYWNR